MLQTKQMVGITCSVESCTVRSGKCINKANRVNSNFMLTLRVWWWRVSQNKHCSQMQQLLDTRSNPSGKVSRGQHETNYYNNCFTYCFLLFKPSKTHPVIQMEMPVDRYPVSVLLQKFYQPLSVISYKNDCISTQGQFYYSTLHIKTSAICWSRGTNAVIQPLCILI